MRLFGHPLHPMLVHFPIAFWTVATGAEGAALSGFAGAGTLATAANAAGLATGLLAMAAGAVDLLDLRKNSAAMATAERHLLLMGAAWTAYLAALLLRVAVDTAASGGDNWPAAACALAGFVLLGIGGWHGAQLVYGHGAGVQDRRRQTHR